MGVSITIRDVPNEVRDELAARAARAGRSLQEHLRLMLIEHTAKPDVAELMARVRGRLETTGTHLSSDEIVAFIRQDRDDPSR